jgi:hypothetical protein
VTFFWHGSARGTKSVLQAVNVFFAAGAEEAASDQRCVVGVSAVRGVAHLIATELLHTTRDFHVILTKPD